MDQVIYVDTSTTVITVAEPADFNSRVVHVVNVGDGSSVLQLLAALNGYTSLPTSLTQSLPMPILKVVFEA